MTFDDRIAPLLIRLTGIERSETLLAERAESAAARSADIGPLTKRVAGQFPKIALRKAQPRFASDPVHHAQRHLRPISPILRRQWKSRRRTLAQECPTLAKATERATIEAAIIDTQSSSLRRRTEAARRGRIPREPAADAHGFWLRLLRSFFWRHSNRQSPAAADVDLRSALTRPARLTEASRGIEQQPMQLRLLALELQRVEELLDQCEAQLTK